MTLAICVACGREKLGAWTRCVGCGLEPTSAEERAKALALSDRFLAAAELQAIAGRIKSGEPAAFDASVLALAAELEALPAPRTPLGCHVAVWTPVVIMVALTIAVAVLYGYCIPHAG